MSRCLATLVLGFALACGSKAEEDAKPIDLPSARPAPASAAPVSTGPVIYGSCAVATEDDNDCLEFRDPEIAAEWKGQCKGTFSERACPRANVTGSCRYPDGTLRLGFPPRPNTFYDRACKDAQGQYLAAATLPEEHEVVLASCTGKYDEGCEEEEIHSPARVAIAEDECRSLQGTWSRGKPCPRENLVGECDLPGKRRVFMTSPQNADARNRFCTQKRGRLVGASPTPTSSQSAEPDPDPPAERGEIEIRR